MAACFGILPPRDPLDESDDECGRYGSGSGAGKWGVNLKKKAHATFKGRAERNAIAGTRGATTAPLYSSAPM